MLKSLGVIVFLVGIFFFMHFVAERSWVQACIVFTLSIMLMPFFVECSWKDRVAAILAMPFWTLGFLLATVVFWRLMEFRRFGAIFNNPGWGPLAWWLLGLGFACISWFFVFRLVRSLWTLAGKRKGG
jgi:hypothetical protein